jgi:undecaprenyl diphosphate synthase
MIDTTVELGETLYYSTKPSDMFIYKENSLGQRENLFSILDINNKNFFELPQGTCEIILEAENETKDYNKITVNIALNYGGRAELVHSVKAIAEKVKCGEIAVEDINEDLISQNIYTAGQPDPDIIVRPSGEYRLSNFLTWQSAYSEFWFSDILWPDFTTDDVDAVLEDFQKRHRRFGGV